MKKSFLLWPLLSFLFFVSTALPSFAAVKVLFHPFDPTLETIGQYFDQAQKSAQVVMYNIDVTEKSPLIQYMASSAFQKKIKAGFQVQMIFEGYASPEENAEKMKVLENLGLDVRFLGLEQKAHHKFALFDSGLPTERLVTGSANWSMASMMNYDENILFIDAEPGIASQYSAEFALLWNHAQEFGNSFHSITSVAPKSPLGGDLHAFFNSKNYDWSKAQPTPVSELNPELTKTLVAAINQAQSTLEIATTRIKLAPVYAALLKAAERGVKIKIVVSQAEYLIPEKRAKVVPRKCGNNIYAPNCSAGINFSPLLDSSITQMNNMQIRLKFFSVKLTDDIVQQMHNKYMIVDGRWILTGSFNWSNSSEWHHLENLVVIDGQKHKAALASFKNNHKYLWTMNRNSGLDTSNRKECLIQPRVLSFQEIDQLMKNAAEGDLAKCLPKK